MISVVILCFHNGILNKKKKSSTVFSVIKKIKNALINKSYINNKITINAKKHNEII